MNNANTCPDVTPWGPAQHKTQIGAGVWRVDTASHGGYWLHPTALSQLPLAWIGFVGYSCCEEWFEEDCDWAVLAVSFPALWNDFLIYCAFKTLRGMDYPKAPALSTRQRLWMFLQTDAGRTLYESAVKWERDHGHLFSIGSLVSDGRGWSCSAYRIDGGQRVTWDQADYPCYTSPFDLKMLDGYKLTSTTPDNPHPALSELPRSLLQVEAA